MNIVGAWGMEGSVVVRSLGEAAAERVEALARDVVGLSEEVRAARDRVAGTVATSWESRAATAFRDGVRRHVGLADAAAEHLRRSVDELLRAADDIRQRINGIAATLEVLERRLTESVHRHAAHLGLSVGAAMADMERFVVDVGGPASEELRTLGEAYRRHAHPEALDALRRAVAGSGRK